MSWITKIGSVFVVVVVLVASLSLILDLPAYADGADGDVRPVDGQEESEQEEGVSNSETLAKQGFLYTSELMSTASGGVRVTPRYGGSPISILPVINEEREDYQHAALIYEDGGFAFWEMINDENDVSTFTYNVRLGRDQSLVSDGQGGYIIQNKAGHHIIHVKAPWALDAKNTPVPASYDVKGDTIILNVDHTSAVYEYPIVADPCFRFWRGRCGRNMGTSAAGGLLGARFFTMGFAVATIATGGTAAPVTVTGIVASSAFGIAWGVTWCAFTCNP